MPADREMKAMIIAMLLAAAMAMAGCAQENAKEAKAKGETVQVDFLYYNNCTYCVQMKPRLQSAAGKFGAQVNVRLLDAELRGIDANVTEAYQKYKMEGKFGGFPTLVADGNSTLVGLRGENEIGAWICNQFTVKPNVCG